MKVKKGATMFCVFDCCMSGTIMDLPYRYEFTADTHEDVTDERGDSIREMQAQFEAEEAEEEEAEEASAEA